MPVEVQQDVRLFESESAFDAERLGYQAHLELWEEMRRLVDTYPRWQILKELCEREATNCFTEWLNLKNLHRPEIQECSIMLRERARTLRWLWKEPEQLASNANRETWLDKLKDLGERFTQWLENRRKGND
jgi:hypothetical protein